MSMVAENLKRVLCLICGDLAFQESTISWKIQNMEFNGSLLHLKDKVLSQAKFLIINLLFSVIQLLSSAELMITIILLTLLNLTQTNAHGKN